MPSLQPYDALAQQPADRDDINAARDRMEIAPIQVGGYMVDCDPKSETRMVNALQVFDTIAPTGTLDWTMADNSVVALTRPQLDVVYNDMLVARAVRSAQLHARATEIKGRLPGVTMRDIEPENWG
ncbi:hypothetical protein GCM10023116_35790 [Kistimonas scapharcae]|uniref:DUF4376 domain-containing protein n=1 Tax=Kistimonas scapharcae TaxID=1036133 RepID=A0ABP8V7R8_9GAMM